MTFASVQFVFVLYSHRYEIRTSLYCIKANISASRISIVYIFTVVSCNTNRYIDVVYDANQSNLRNMIQLFTCRYISVKISGKKIAFKTRTLNES